MPVKRSVCGFAILALVFAYQVAAVVSEKQQQVSVAGLTASQIEDELQVYYPLFLFVVML